MTNCYRFSLFYLFIFSSTSKQIGDFPFRFAHIHNWSFFCVFLVAIRNTYSMNWFCVRWYIPILMLFFCCLLPYFVWYILCIVSDSKRFVYIIMQTISFFPSKKMFKCIHLRIQRLPLPDIIHTHLEPFKERMQRRNDEQDIIWMPCASRVHCEFVCVQTND